MLQWNIWHSFHSLKEQRYRGLWTKVNLFLFVQHLCVTCPAAVVKWVSHSPCEVMQQGLTRVSHSRRVTLQVCHTPGVSHPVPVPREGLGKDNERCGGQECVFLQEFFGGIPSRGFSAHSRAQRGVCPADQGKAGLQRDWGSLVLNCRCQRCLGCDSFNGFLKWFLIWRVGKTFRFYSFFHLLTYFCFWNCALNFSLRCTIKLQPGIIKIIHVQILRLQLLFLFCVQLGSGISYKLFWKPNFSFFYFDQFSIDLICNDCFLYC